MKKFAINFNLLTTFYANSLKISHCIIIIIILFSYKTQHYHNEMNMKILIYFSKKKKTKSTKLISQKLKIIQREHEKFVEVKYTQICSFSQHNLPTYVANFHYHLIKKNFSCLSNIQKIKKLFQRIFPIPNSKLVIATFS